jgi:hypothetical protein
VTVASTETQIANRQRNVVGRHPLTSAGILTAYIANTIGYGGAAPVIIIATKGRLGLPEPAPA